MSRVTVREFYNDVSDIDIEDLKRYEKIKHIEIVPRKMVEMIIEKCESTINCACYTEDNMRVLEARDIKAYVLSLLKQFEEDDE